VDEIIFGNNAYMGCGSGVRLPSLLYKLQGNRNNNLAYVFIHIFRRTHGSVKRLPGCKYLKENFEERKRKGNGMIQRIYIMGVFFWE